MMLHTVAAEYGQHPLAVEDWPIDLYAEAAKRIEMRAKEIKKAGRKK